MPISGGRASFSGISGQRKVPATEWRPGWRWMAGWELRETTGTGAPPTVTSWGHASAWPGRVNHAASKTRTLREKRPAAGEASRSRVEGQTGRRAVASLASGGLWWLGASRRTHGIQGVSGAGMAGSGAAWAGGTEAARGRSHAASQRRNGREVIM